MLNSGRTPYATSATSDSKCEQGPNYFIKYVLCLDTTMLRKFENENKNQNKKNLRLKIYEKIRNGRLKLEPSVLIRRKTCTRISTNVVRKNNETAHVVRTNNEWRYGSGAGRITTANNLIPTKTIMN